MFARCSSAQTYGGYVSDDIPSDTGLSAEERATTFDEMITVALETAIA